MLIILSPAKKQKFSSCSFKEQKLPNFTAETQELINHLREYSQEEIQKLMEISPELAALNEQRFKDFDITYDTNSKSPAILAFQGDAYRSLQAQDFNESEQEFCQNHLAIISGLYGLLNPYDLIQPYRLEMKTKIKTEKANNLYEFWGNKISKALEEKMENHKNKIIINLASDEYAKAIQKNTLKSPIIKIDFKEHKNDKYQTIGIHAKKARGAMTRYIIKNKLNECEQITEFNCDNYKFNHKMSTENNYIFTR